MISVRTMAIGLVVAMGSALPAAAATVYTLNTGFESPTFAIGNLTGSPGGWAGGGAAVAITGDIAHTGTQSLRTTAGDGAYKALDAVGTSPYNPNSGGEFPFHGGGFTLFAGYDWWVQAWVWINPGATARITLFSGLGGCPLLDIGDRGFGNDPTEPYANSCLSNSGDQPSLGPAVYGQWLKLEMVHTTAMGAGMEFRITGTGINRTIALGSYSGPGSGAPAYLGLFGDAWWDDVGAGYGDVPAVVPLPGAALLLASALGALARCRRRS